MIKQKKDIKGQKKALKRIKKVLNREIPDEELSGVVSYTVFFFLLFHGKRNNWFESMTLESLSLTFLTRHTRDKVRCHFKVQRHSQSIDSEESEQDKTCVIDHTLD